MIHKSGSVFCDTIINNATTTKYEKIDENLPKYISCDIRVLCRIARLHGLILIHKADQMQNALNILETESI